MTQTTFLALPEATRAKKLSDRLRVISLRLGKDWHKALQEYNQWVVWHVQVSAAPDPLKCELHPPFQLPHLLALYEFWRSQAGLSMQRDMYLQPEPGDQDTPRSPAIDWHILAHNLRSAYNMGSVFRTADCFHLSAVHASGYSAPPHHASLQSAARQCQNWIPYTYWDDPRDCIAHFHNQGYVIAALETGSQALAIDQVQWPSRGLLLLGNEELGIAPELLEHCSLQIEIPMYGRKASLNVASALAITCHTLRSALASAKH